MACTFPYKTNKNGSQNLNFFISLEIYIKLYNVARGSTNKAYWMRPKGAIIIFPTISPKTMEEYRL